MPDTDTRWLERDDGVPLAYARRTGTRPGVVFLGGYASDMSGTKATWLDERCCRRGRSFLRFDYRGHGQSGGRFEDGTIGAWTADALAVLDSLTEGPQILVGSSMGGWIMLNVALARPRRVAALVGIAAAPDFSQNIFWSLPSEDQERLRRDGAITVEEEDGGYTVTHDFIEEARRHLVMRGPIAIDVPVRLLHGMQDSSVAWSLALDLAARLATDDVHVHLVADGDHRLSRDPDLALLGRTLDGLEDAASAASPSR